MKTAKFNHNWKFWKVTDSFALNWAAPADARVLDLPHDAMIEVPQDPASASGSNSGYRIGGIYNYSKNLYADNPSKTYILKIEGAYMNAFVFVNGQMAAKRPYGYTVFYVPLNAFLNFGEENEIRIQVRSGAEPNSRWYPGTGLYRDVYLLEAGSSYILPDSVKIRADRIHGIDQISGGEALTAEIEVTAAVSMPEDGSNCVLQIILKDPDGNVVAKESAETTSAEADSSLCSPEESFSFSGLKEKVSSFQQTVTISDPKLWDVDSPRLYTCELQLLCNGETIDTHTDSFGIRSLSLSPSEGLKVNGRSVKLRGACIHHDSGILGSRTYESVHIRQISRLKEAGFNAIRCAHNPAAPALLRACDKVGMFVMDEAFDMWTRHKSDYDYGLFFNEWCRSDIKAMVRNDYNHPSVIMYSVGNEIPETGTPLGGQITKTLCETVRSLDDSRYTLASVNGIFAVGDEMGQIVADTASDLQSQGKHDGNVNDFMAFMHGYMGEMVKHPIIDRIISVPFEYTDIAGYNYMDGRYETDGSLHPGRVIVGSETGISTIVSNWAKVKKLPYLIGDFCWTGWDYLGEVGVGFPNYSGNNNPFGNAAFPMQTSCTGDTDITGIRGAASYFRQIVFGERKDPYIAVQDPAHYGETLIHNPWIITDAIGSWSWDRYEGKPVVVEVYAAGNEVELFKNGTSLGRKLAGEEAGYKACFETVWEPGTLTAVSYENGSEAGRFELSSAGPDIRLHLYRDALTKTEEILKKDVSDEQEIIYYCITLADSKGIVCMDRDQEVHLELEGNVQLLGFGSADPRPQHNYNEKVTKTYRGRAQLIVSRTAEGKDAVIRICTDSGLSAEWKL